MTRHDLARISASIVAAAFAAGPADAQDVAASGQFGAGVQLTDVNGSDEKFQEYRDVRDGFELDQLSLDVLGGDTQALLRLELQNVAQADESYRLTLGRLGRYRLDLSYDSTPHRFSGGNFVFGGFGSDYLRVPPAVRAAAEANQTTAAERSGGTVNPATDPNADPLGRDAAQRVIALGLIGAGDGVRFQLQRRAFGAGLQWDFTDALSAWARVDNENRDGARVISAGTYERWNVGSGAAHRADRFMVAGQDLAEPIDYRTLRLAAGAGVHRESWTADLEYAFTNFRNFNTALRWDNPFRATDLAQTSAGFNRGLFATSQLALPVDSKSHEITLTGGVALPLHGRFTAALGYGMVKQDEDFLPYTLNTAVLATNAGNAPAATLALPRSDLGGDVRTASASAAVALRPLEPLSLDVRYRLYRYDNRSQRITFPGYSAFGDSAWRTIKNDRNAPVVNDVFDFNRQNADVGVGLHVARPLSLHADVGWERWKFIDLRLDRTDEYFAAIGFTARPMRQTSVRASYRYADRSAEGYAKGRTLENPEATGLMNFNWSDRTRHQIEARAQTTLSPMLQVGLTGRLRKDSYGGETEGDTVVDQFRFGRTELRSATGAIDVTVRPAERLSMNLSYGREWRKESLANAAKDDGVKATDDFGAPDDYAPENYWNSTILERVDTIGLAFTVDVVPERVVLEAGYDLSLSVMDVDTRNPGAIQATTLANAVAQDWPDIRNRLHELRGDVAYRVHPNVRAGVRYIFERYDLDDFAWDQLDPYMAGRTPENSTRFIFADATYGGYKAHVGTLYVAGTF